MSHDLIDDETLDALPDDPGLAFVMVERACRDSLNRLTEREDNGAVIESVRLDYMHDVIAAARHYEIPDIKDFKLPNSRSFDWNVYEDFNRRVRFYTMQYRLTARTQRNNFSVELQETHKDRIRTLIAHLKTAVDKADDLPDWRKDRLRKSIADFEKSLDSNKRLTFVNAMTFLAIMGAGLHGVGEGAAGIGKLVHEITVAIGQSKEIEDATKLALPETSVKAPIYLIEDTTPEARVDFSRSELDDEIPF